MTEAAWRRLEERAHADAARPIASLFDAEPERLARMTLDAAGLHLDLSKQPWSAAGLDAALALAEAAGVAGRRDALFAGDPVNASEGRAALHMALRAPDGAEFCADGEPISRQVEATRAAMRAFVDGVRLDAIRGATGETFNALLHIGIGGSDLGPRLVWEALRPLEPKIELRFAANVDGAEIEAALAGLDPARTLVIAASKTFSTLETLANVEAARDWLRAALGPAGDAHMLGVTANTEAAQAFGIAAERTFAFQDWVGGRFSLWSPVGLSCAVGLGWNAFQALLDGAAAMDAHFRDAPSARNAPVLLALAHVYNRNGLGRAARAVIPYARRLALLPAFLQQLEMESNGKGVGADGAAAPHRTSGVVFGEPGTNAQHAFFQLLHQGADIVPTDIIAIARSGEGPADAQAKLLANALAQAEALMVGRPESEVRHELARAGMPPDDIEILAPQRTFPGDRPTSFLLLPALTPQTLGALLALYEHKTFVEGALWGINSFDQWGVELGKTLAGRILPELEGEAPGLHDPSTTALIARLKR